ncbi:MAG: hypothetical protein WBD12_03095 [Candidatus Omnitrophota bacterium]
MKRLGKRLFKNKKLEEILKQLDYMEVQMMRVEQEVKFYKNQLSGVRKAQEDFFEAGKKIENGRAGISGNIDEKLAKLEADILELKKRNWHLSETQSAMKDLFQKALMVVKEKEQVINGIAAENSRLKEKASLLSRPPSVRDEGETSIDALMEQIARIDIRGGR